MNRVSLPRRGWRIVRTALRACAAALMILPSYALLAYVLLPASWSQFQKRLPREGNGISYTAEGIPADPLNVALVGTREEVVEAMRAAGWVAADRITLRSGWRDAHSVLFNRSYPAAPVSTHYLGDRPQDLAFEQQVGKSPRRRHHVRFWRVEDPSPRGSDRPLWIGAATYDAALGVSRFTGEVMHHIDPEVDRERERLLADLEAGGVVERVTRAQNFRPAGDGRNGGGDPYRTDGALAIAVLRPSPAGSACYSAPEAPAPSRSDKS
ncbi:MAG TPA: LssY C-terminal domain-containing protein [Thermoanaerobaculia bacterium]|nr:LssY C-terminal domain-containing protein [Thermoanaerobaculia bacterium]